MCRRFFMKSCVYNGINLHDQPVQIIIHSEIDFNESKKGKLVLEKVAVEAALHADGAIVTVLVEPSSDSIAYQIENMKKEKIVFSQLDTEKTLAELAERKITAA